MDTHQQMQAVLLELMLLMHGKTQAWNPPTSGGRERDPRPPGDAHPVAEHYAHEYARASNDLARQRVLHDAREELDRWRGHGVRRHAGETQEAEDARMVVEGEGWTVDEVARAFSCTKTRVRRACDEHGIEIDYQERLCAAGAVSRAHIATAMDHSGSSQHQIAAVLGVSQPTVSRLLKTATSRQAA